MIKCLFALLLTLLAFTPARAQETAPTAMPPEQIAADIKALHPKTLVLVFDVTESTRHGGVFGQERAAAATLLREGCLQGDRIVLEKFGTSYTTVFDKTLATAADAGALVDQIPAAPEPGHGTNIRLPHHEALKLLDRETNGPGVVVLLTDSFNDRPDPNGPDYGKYLAYYTLKGLTVYPHTPENRDYERLLRKLKASGRLHEYGVDVGIAPSGRPIERLPVGPGQSDADATDTIQTPTVLKPVGIEKPQSSLPLLLGGGLAALLLLGGVAYALLNRPVAVRLKLGDRSQPRDFRLRPGAKISLGGSPASVTAGGDVFALAGLTAPIAYVQAVRGGLSLIPGPASEPPVPMFHNGVRVERESPLRVGDEIRILAPTPDGLPPREHRVRLEDPRAPLF